jgi:hypothetical protein
MKTPAVSASLAFVLLLAACGGPTDGSLARDGLSRDPCANYPCEAAEHCTAPDDVPRCVADTPHRDPCADFFCPAGEHCVAPGDVPSCVAD